MFHEFNHEFGSKFSIYSFKDEDWLKCEFPSIAKPWKELCQDNLPKPEHAKLRERLLRLEDGHRPAMRMHFPQDERPRRLLVSLATLGIPRRGADLATTSTNDNILLISFNDIYSRTRRTYMHSVMRDNFIYVIVCLLALNFDI